MSTNLIHFLTVIGITSQEIEETCDELIARVTAAPPGELDSDNWPAAERAEVDELGTRLLSATRHLPVYYYSQYLDPWSFVAELYHSLGPDEPRRQLFGDHYVLSYYPSHFAQQILSVWKAERRHKAYRDHREYRWFMDHLREATEAALWLKSPFLVVTLLQHVGGSRDNFEIESSLDRPLFAGEDEPLRKTPGCIVARSKVFPGDGGADPDQ